MAENKFEDVVDKRLPLLQDADLYDKVRDHCYKPPNSNLPHPFLVFRNSITIHEYNLNRWRQHLYHFSNKNVAEFLSLTNVSNLQYFFMSFLSILTSVETIPASKNQAENNGFDFHVSNAGGSP